MAAGLNLSRALFAFAVAAGGNFTCAFEPVFVSGEPSLQLQWQPAKHAGRRPAIIALHGCGGLYDSRGRFDDRYTWYAQRWNAAGWHVVAPDSFGSRGQGSICTQAPIDRTIKVTHRREDVLRTAAWLMQRDDVDPQRIAIVGWSHGGSTALEVVDRSLWLSQPPAAIVMYYPGCSGWKKRPLGEPTAPMLMLLGDADDWTPAAACKDLAERYQSEYPGTVLVHAYADSYHGFDRPGPVRFLANIPAGVNKRGVHVGGNSAARAAALTELDRFLTRYLQSE